VITDQLHVSVTAFEEETGWALKPEGACKGDVCVPLPSGAVTDGVADLTVIGERLGMPIVHDEPRGLYALGPESLGGHALVSAEAPELVLPTIDGDEFRLSSLRGSKVLLVAWAPY
jgi:hypothetical protein